ncbi:hypothetical protein BROUX41_003941 [Berkeleyomyces rouxiae]|uniref:uncharacterized protein n=1 Tax=Berkeleyomyces rouxiae TaxID=2035830 RepID=UPI003B7FBF3B
MRPAPRSSPSSIWTASRRHRLLRSLHNRLNAIRNILTPTRESCEKKMSTNSRRSSKSHYKYAPESPKRHQKRSRVTYTYARKSTPTLRTETPQKPKSGRVNDNTKPTRLTFRAPMTPGRVPLETPLVRKIRQFDTPGRPAPLFDPQSTSSRKSSYPDTLASIQANTDPRLYSEYDFVLRSVKVIIAQTCPRKDDELSKSLMGICLRKVTDVINALEQQQEEQQREEGSKSLLSDNNVSANIYAHLEAMNTQGLGWEPLRIVVLHEATEMLRDAMCEGLLSRPFIQILIQQFAANDLLSEASLLLETATDMQYELPPDEGDTQVLPPNLALLYDFCKQNHKRDLLFRILEHLLFSGKLPGEWLSTKAFAPIWSETLNALANATPCRTIMDFTAMALATLSYSAGVKAVPVSKAQGSKSSNIFSTSSAQICERTLISVLGAIVALALVNRKTSPDGVMTSGTITRRINFILTYCVSHARQKFRRTRNRDCISVLTLAHYLASHGSSDLNCHDWDSCVALAGSDLEKSLGSGVDCVVYNMLVMLVCSAAQGSSRASSVAPHRHLIELCKPLQGTTICGRALDSIKIDGAILLSQRTGDLRDVVFAESLANKKQRSAKAKAKKSLPTPQGMYSGYQWDDALSEWVDCTETEPAIMPSRRATPVVVTVRRLKRTSSTISDKTTSSHHRSKRITSFTLPFERRNEKENESCTPPISISDEDDTNYKFDLNIPDEDLDGKNDDNSQDNFHDDCEDANSEDSGDYGERRCESYRGQDDDDDELAWGFPFLQNPSRNQGGNLPSKSHPQTRRVRPSVKMSTHRREALLKSQRPHSYSKISSSRPGTILTSIGSWAGSSSDDDLI